MKFSYETTLYRKKVTRSVKYYIMEIIISYETTLYRKKVTRSVIITLWRLLSVTNQLWSIGGIGE